MSTTVDLVNVPESERKAAALPLPRIDQDFACRRIADRHTPPSERRPPTRSIGMRWWRVAAFGDMRRPDVNRPGTD